MTMLQRSQLFVLQLVQVQGLCISAGCQADARAGQLEPQPSLVV